MATRIMASNAAGRPPSLSSAAIAKLVKEYFYFHDVDERSVKQLPSYDDRNFYFRGCATTPEPASSITSRSILSDREYILKLNNPLIVSYDVLSGINDLLNHLHAKSFTKCNQPLASRGGDLLKITKEELLEYEGHLEPVETGDKSGECTYFLRVLTFIPGECFDKVDKHCLTPRLLYDVGHCIGSAEAILQVAI